MTDEKKNMIVPFGMLNSTAARDAMSESEGRQALLSDLPADSEERQAALPGHMENGVRVITYTFDAEKPRHLSGKIFKSAIHVRALEHSDRSTVREGLAEIEKIANIRFREVPVAEKETADFRYFKGKITDSKTGGYATEEDGMHEIMLDNDNSDNLGVILHETLHALALSHPEANNRGGYNGGDNPRYSKDTTVMSYNWGHSQTRGMGAFDVAALQFLYGKPPPEDCPKQVGIEEITKAKFLFGHLPVTVDVRGAKYTGDLVVNTGRGIAGSLHNDKENVHKTVTNRLVSDTRIKDVLADPETTVNLVLTGNELQNRLQGGGNYDALTPRGGQDTLTGGKGADTFVIDGRSGFDNLITDFSLGDKDKITLKAHHRELEWHDAFPINGVQHQGTRLILKDAAYSSIGSVFIIGATPGKISERITTLPSSEHPSGLPAAAQTSSRNNDRGK